MVLDQAVDQVEGQVLQGRAVPETMLTVHHLTSRANLVALASMHKAVFIVPVL